MEVPYRSLDRYQALAFDKLTVLAEANSYRELGSFVGLSNVTVRNNMDWEPGTDFLY